MTTDTMTSDTFRPEFDPKTLNGALTAGKLNETSILTFIGYTGVFVGYMIIFMASLLTVGFLEIRQANMTDFNALIAVLDQRDRYNKDHHLEKTLDDFSAQREAYRSWIGSLACADIAATTVVTGNGRATEPGNRNCSPPQNLSPPNHPSLRPGLEGAHFVGGA